MFLIGPIAGWLVKRGLSEQGSRSLAWAMLIGAAILAAALGWRMLKGSIIEEHETEQRLETAERTLERTNDANAVDDEIEARDEATIEELEEGARHAAQSDPEGAGRAVGPVTSSVHDGLRTRRRPD